MIKSGDIVAIEGEGIYLVQNINNLVAHCLGSDNSHVGVPSTQYHMMEVLAKGQKRDPDWAERGQKAWEKRERTLSSIRNSDNKSTKKRYRL